MIRAPLSRADHLARLVAGPVDVLVIGGGITGAGVALDAASRGYTVGLVEQADFASGTSSRSTKLIHGGIRYLAKGHLHLVREALHERTLLLNLAPWLVRPQPFLIPLYAHMRRPLGLAVPTPFRTLAPLAIGVGLWAYDQLARSGELAHRRISPDEVGLYAPRLVPDGLQAVYLYHDARADDVRLTHAVLRSARAHGALTVNYARVGAFLYQQGRVSGVRIEDRLTGQPHDLAARYVINATGVWSDRVAELDTPLPVRVQPSKGIHLILRKGVVDSRTALVIPETDDGRLLFLTPWAGHMLVGTTDDPFSGSLETPEATMAEVAYLLDHVNRYLTPPIGPSEIVGVYAGLRPLVASREAVPRDLSREHLVLSSPSGLISIVGGKLTSYRKMAEDTVDELTRLTGDRRPSRTGSLPLDGTLGWEDARRAAAVRGLPPDQQDHLIAAYGARVLEVLEITKESLDLCTPLIPDEPVLAAEVVYACRAEMCTALADFMFLRSRLSVVADDAGAIAVERVAALMAAELGWDASERGRQLETWERVVERERAALSEVRRATPDVLARHRPGRPPRTSSGKLGTAASDGRGE